MSAVEPLPFSPRRRRRLEEDDDVEYVPRPRWDRQPLYHETPAPVVPFRRRPEADPEPDAVAPGVVDAAVPCLCGKAHPCPDHWDFRGLGYQPRLLKGAPIPVHPEAGARF